MADAIFRCSDGDLFTSRFIPGVSFKAIRLGVARYQRCPVGRHWSLCRRVKPEELTEQQRIEAAKFTSRVP